MRAWIIAIAICFVFGAFILRSPLRHRETRIDHRITSTGWVQYATTRDFKSNGFISAVSLANSAIVAITFSRDMRSETLTQNTVRVISEKHRRDVTDVFRFQYNPQDRRLTLHPIDTEFFGTGNLVTVRVSSDVRDSDGMPMGNRFEWSFNT